MAGYSSHGLVRPFAEQLLLVDLPGLSDAQREEVTAFTVGRVDDLPSVLRVGVTCVAVPMRIVVAMPRSDRVLSWLIRHPLPVLGEYVRMVRSLAYTYVWERWPHALPDGSLT
jgi:hypothetical protein